LLAYNEADCVNLQPLADAFYCRLVQASGIEEPSDCESQSMRLRNVDWREAGVTVDSFLEGVTIRYSCQCGAWVSGLPQSS
jgi:hypothetical protein